MPEEPKKTKLIKFDSRITKFWTDPVFSTIISFILITVITLIVSSIQSIFTDDSFIKTINSLLTTKISIYTILFVFALLGILNSFWIKYKNWKGLTKLFTPLFNQEQNIGKYTFRELYNSLVLEEIKVKHHNVNISLVALFHGYEELLNSGVNIDGPGPDYHFVYFNLAPKLMSYGLVESVFLPGDSGDANSQLQTFRTSEIGYEFRSALHKWIMYNSDPKLLTIPYNVELKEKK